ncbi:MAG: Ig-like domain-containing protein [Bifidobacteriaceae bacterium]|nr:Ig-like domain-containing protein [Bifidobacteriaceae bacterium]
MSAPNAEATQRYTDSTGVKWNGVFTTDQLWFHSLTDVSAFTAFTSAQLKALPARTGTSGTTGMDVELTPRLLLHTNPSTANNETGTNRVAGHRTIAVGPVFKKYGSDTLHMVDFANANSAAASIYRGAQPPNGGPVQADTWSTLPTCGVTDRRSSWSGEINQKNGYLYSVGGDPSPDLSGGTVDITGAVVPRIYLASNPASSTRGWTCMASTNKIWGAGGKSLNTQWAELTRLSGHTTWQAGSDMAIDAHGNLYLFLTGSTSHHALLKISVPVDADGEPEDGVPNGNKKWEYEIVRAFTNTVEDDSSTWGMAFVDGWLYTWHANGRLRSWNPLSGDYKGLGDVKVDPRDLAAAQVAPSIQGRVFNDVNGNGVQDNGEIGVPNLEVEIWRGNAQTGSTTWTRSGVLKTNSSGNYVGLLDSPIGEYLVRVKRPVLTDGTGSSALMTNAYQTAASRGTYYEDQANQAGAYNTVQPYCATTSGDYELRSLSTPESPCYGARADGIDALDAATGNPLAATGGANIISHVNMSTDKAVVEANFGVSTYGSWGDAATPYKSVRTASGPAANPKRFGQPYLYLGDVYGQYPDGVADPNADTHAADDGLEIAPAVSGTANANLDYVPAQGQPMVQGQDYVFRLKANGDPAAIQTATIKGWISQATGTGTSQTFGSSVECPATPDPTTGYVYCEYTAPASTTVKALFSRVRISSDTLANADSRNTSNAATKAWLPFGEIEDYGMALAPAVVRIQAQTKGVPASVRLSMTNVSSIWPSYPTTQITTDGNAPSPSPRTHAIDNASSNVTITTTQVGATAATTGLSGWKLLGEETKCWASEDSSKAALGVQVTGNNITLQRDSGSPKDVTCLMTYGPEWSTTDSTLTADPSNNQLSPLSPGGKSNVVANVQGTVTAADGQQVTTPAAGTKVDLILAAGTGDINTAKFQVSTDGGTTWVDKGPSYTCTIGNDGNCAERVVVTATGAGSYQLSAKVGTEYVSNADGSGPTDNSPVVIWFQAGGVSSGTIALTDTADKVANHGQANPADSYTMNMRIVDASGNGILDQASNFVFTCGDSPSSLTACGSAHASGIRFGTPVAGAQDGDYSVQVYSTTAGTKYIGVSVSGITLTNLDDSTKPYVQATFIPGPPEDGTSSFAITSTGTRYTSVTNSTTQADTFHTGLVTIKDANGNGIPGALINGSPVQLSWPSSLNPGAVRATFEAGTNPGEYLVKLWSSAEAENAGLQVQISWTEGANPRTLNEVAADPAEFIHREPLPGSSFITVDNSSVQIANWGAPGIDASNAGKRTIYATLINGDGFPYADGEGRLQAHTSAQPLVFGDSAGDGYLTCAAAPVNGKCEDGVYKIDVYSSAAGDWDVQVRYTPLQGNAYDIRRQNSQEDFVSLQYSPGPIVQGESRFGLGVGEANPEDSPFEKGGAYQGTPVSRATGVAFTPSIKTWDAGQNNPVPNVPVKLVLTDPSSGTCAARFDANNGLVVTGTTSDPAGQFQTTVISAVPTTCVINAYYVDGNGTDVLIPGSPKTLTWIPRLVDFSSYTLSTGNVEVGGDEKGTITVVLKNGAAPVTGVGGQLVAVPADQNSNLEFSSSWTENPLGTYTAQFWGNKSGNWRVFVELGGDRLDLLNPGGNDIAHMVPRDPEPDASWLIQPDDSAIARKPGETLRVGARLTDGLDNAPATGTPVVFTLPANVIAVNAAGIDVPGATITATTDSDGYAYVDVRATEQGAYVITATVNGESILTVKNEDENDELADDGEVEVVFTTEEDPANDNSVLTIPTTGPSGTETMLVSTGDYKHRAEVLVKDSYDSVFKDGTASVTFCWSYEDTRWGHQGPVTGCTPSPIPTNGDGIAAFEFSSEAATTWAITAKIVELGATAPDVPPSPVDATFVPGPPVDGDSWLVEPSGTAVANTTQTLPVRVHLVDEFGNPAADTAVTFTLQTGLTAVTAGGDVTGTLTVTSAAGYATINVKGAEPQTYSVQASIPAGSIDLVKTAAEQNKSPIDTDGSADVTFTTDGGPVDDHSELTVPTAGADFATKVQVGGTGHHAQVLVMDGIGNIFRNGTASVIYCWSYTDTRYDPAGTLVEGCDTSPIPTDANGYAHRDFPSAVAVDWTIHAYLVLGGTAGSYQLSGDVINSPATVGYLPGPPELDKTWLIEPAGSAIAKTGATLTVGARVHDANDNPVGPTPVTFTLPAALTAVVGGVDQAGPTVVVTTADGYASVDVKSDVVGTHTVTASVAAGTITVVKNATEEAVERSTGDAHVVFTTEPTPNPDASEFTIITADADGLPAKRVNVDNIPGEEHTAQVLVKDTVGNRFTNGAAEVQFCWSYTDTRFEHNNQPVNQCAAQVVPTDQDGYATYSFTSDVATVWNVTARIVGIDRDVNGTSKKAAFKPGPVDPEDTVNSLRVDQDPGRTDGRANVRATMTVQDGGGNAIPNAPGTCGFNLPTAGATENDGPMFSSDWLERDPNKAKQVSGKSVDGNGVCAVDIRSYVDGDFGVEGLFGSARTAPPLPEAHFNNIVVTSGEFSVAPSQGNPDATKVVANGSDGFDLEFALFTTGGDPAPMTAAMVYWQLGDNPAQYREVTTGTTGADRGVGKTKITTTTAGTYKVWVTHAGFDLTVKNHAPDTRADMVFVPGPPSLIESEFTYSPSPVPNDRAYRHTMQVILRDENRNLIPDYNVYFTIGGDYSFFWNNNGVPGNQTLLVMTSNPAGVAQAHFSDDAVERDLVGTARLSSATGDVIGSGLFTFDGQGPDPQFSSFTVTPNPALGGIEVGQSYTGRILLQYAANTPAAGLPVGFTNPMGVTINYPNGQVTGPDGILEVLLTTTTVGVYPINATTGGQEINAQAIPLKFNAGPPVPGKATLGLLGTGQALANGQDAHTAVVTAYDQYNNRAVDGLVTFTIEQGGTTPGPEFVGTYTNVKLCNPEDPTENRAWCDQSTKGTARVDIKSQEPGSFELRATVSNQPVTIPEFVTVKFGAGKPSPLASFWSSTPAGPVQVANDASEHRYAVTATIVSEDNIWNDAAQVRLTIPGQGVHVLDRERGLEVNGQIVTTGDGRSTYYGTYTWYVYSTVARTFEGTIEVNDTESWHPIAGNPVRLAFKPGPPKPSTAWLIEPGTSAEANGSDTIPVVMKAVDEFENPAETGTAIFHLPANTSAAGMDAQRNVRVPIRGGQAQVDVSSTVAWVTHTVTADLEIGATTGQVTRVVDSGDNPVNATGEVSLSFGSAPPDANCSQFTMETQNDTVHVGDVEKHRASVEVKDCQGNKVPNVEVRFTHGLTEETIEEGTDTSDQDGIAVYEFGSFVADQPYEVNAYLNTSQLVNGAPATVTFVPGSINIERTLASFDVSGEARANGSATVPATVKVQDQWGNGINGQSITFTMEDLDDDAAFIAPADDPLIRVKAANSTTVNGQRGIAAVGIASYNDGEFPLHASFFDQNSTEHRSVTKKARFLTDVISPKYSHFSVVEKGGNSDRPPVANGTDAWRVTAYLKNPSGDPINASGFVHLTKLSDAGIPLTGQTYSFQFTAGQDNPPVVGQAITDLTRLEAGRYQIRVTGGGDEELATEPDGSVKTVDVTFKAGSMDPNKSFLTGPDERVQADGVQRQTVKATVMDSYDNRLLDQPVTFRVPAHTTAILADNSEVEGGVAGRNVVINTGSSGANAGVAELVLVSRVVGIYPVTATQGGRQIDDEPVDVEFINANLDTGKSIFTIPTAKDISGNWVEKVVELESHTAEVKFFDATNNVYTQPVSVRFDYRLPSVTSDWTQGQVVTTSTGTATWPDFSVLKAGHYDVRAVLIAPRAATIGGLEEARFKHGVPDLSKSRLETTSANIRLPNDVDTHRALATVVDSNDNPVTDAQVTFTLPNGGPAHFVGVNQAQQYSVTMNLSGIGQAEVRIAADSQNPVSAQITALLVDTPSNREIGRDTLRFDWGAACSSCSTFTLTPDTTNPVANGNDTYTANVQVFNAEQPPGTVPGTTVEFQIEGPGIITPDRASVGAPGRPNLAYVTGNNGLLQVSFSTTDAGVYTVTALIAGEPIGQAKTMEFVAGAICDDPVTSFLTGPEFSAKVGGQEIQLVTATLKDCNNNTIKNNASVVFAIPENVLVKGRTSYAPTVTVPVDATTGVAAVELVSNKSGVSNVTGTARQGATASVPIPGAARIEFTAGEINLAHSRLTRIGQAPIRPGGSYQVKAELLDEYDNAIERSSLKIDFGFNLGDRASQTTWGYTDASGVVVVNFTSRMAGDWQGTATYGGQPIETGSPVALPVVHGDVSYGTSVFDRTTLTVMANGTSPHKAWVYLMDADLNPIPGQNIVFNISIGNPNVPGPVLNGASNTATVPTDQDGYAEVTITSNEPETFWITATHSNVGIGSELDVTFGTGAADPSKSSYVLDPETAGADHADVKKKATGDADAEAYTLTVTVNDGVPMLVPNALVRINWNSSPSPVLSNKPFASPLNVTTGPAETNDYGKFQWKLYSTTRGNFTGKVEVYVNNGWHQIGDEFVVRFESGPVDPDTSWLIQPDHSVEANGSDLAEVRAEMRDASMNPADNGSVVFHIPAGLTVEGETSSAASDVEVPIANGVAIVKVSATTVLQDGYMVTADVKDSDGVSTQIMAVKSPSGSDVNSDGEVVLDFDNGPVVPRNSILSITTAGNSVKVGGETHTAQVAVRDATNNAVSGETVLFQYTTGTIEGPHATDYTPGNAAVWYTHPTLSEATSQGEDGIATVNFASDVHRGGTHTAQWIWVQAFIVVNGNRQPVGPPQAVAPAHDQTLVGADFVPGGVDPTNTEASFQTYSSQVLNDGSKRSWARVVVQDGTGGGIGGVPVTFTLPQTQAGADGTPVFVDPAGPPTPVAKQVTITSCARNIPAADVPDECKIDGVYTPGLAYIPIVSNYEGTFPVRAVVGTGSSSFEVGPKDVRFKAGVGDASHSWFTLEQTNPAAAAVRADGIDSYTMTVTVMNEKDGAERLPVSGECVTPTLPPEVTVKADTAPAQGECESGEYSTNNAGQVTWQLVSRRSGTHNVGVALGGTAIATEPEGLTTALPARFVGGTPSFTTTRLTSPAAPVREDDQVNGQPVTVTVRDADGNLATCWTPQGVQVGCQVRFEIPANTWIMSGSIAIEGPATAIVSTQLLTPGVPDADQPLASRATLTFFGHEGTAWVTAEIETPAVLPGGDPGWAKVTSADSIRPQDHEPAAQIQFTDGIDPGLPVVLPSDGSAVSGGVVPGSPDAQDAAEGDLKAVIKDVNDNEIANCPVSVDGQFRCLLDEPLPDGTIVHVVFEDNAGNQSNPVVREIDALPPDDAAVEPSNGTSIDGHVDANDPRDDAEGGLTVIITDQGGNPIAECAVEPNGDFHCIPDEPLEDGTVVEAVVVDPAGNVSAPERIVVDAVPPEIPSAGPTAGEELSGKGEEAGDRITVQDEAGNTLCTSVVNDDLTWSCTLEPAAAEGDMLTILEEDPAHNQISRPWRVGIPELTLAKSLACLSDLQAATAKNFQPGEEVVVTIGGKVVATVYATQNGAVAAEWTVPAEFGEGPQTVTLTGALSGPWTAVYECSDCTPPPPLPFTGASGVIGLTGTGLGLLLAGLLLLLAARRRREHEEERQAA